MLCCECGTMRQDMDNPPIFSSKKQCRGQMNCGRESVAVLEAEQKQAIQEQTSRHACQKHFNRPRCPFKDNDRHTNTEAGRSIQRKRTNLEQLLLTLSGKINSEQGVYKLHQREELELEKAIILCHLLETHQEFLHKRQNARKVTQDGSCFSLTHSRTRLHRYTSASCASKKQAKQVQAARQSACSVLAVPDPCTTTAVVDTCWSSSLKICHPHNTPHAPWDGQPPCHAKATRSDRSPPSRSMERNVENGADYRFLVRQNFELLRALDELEKTCSILRDENGLLRKSSAPETEEKVRRLRRKNTELAVLAKKLEERARKLQEANLRMVSSPSLIRPGSVEQYKRAFARQRARDLAQHADALLCKDKEIAALQRDFEALEAQQGTMKGSPAPANRLEFEKLLRQSQREVLRLQRQLSVTSSTQHPNHNPDPGGPEKCEIPAEAASVEEKVVREAPCVPLDEYPSRCEKTPGEEEEESGLPVTPHSGRSPTLSQQEEKSEEKCLYYLERELTRKRKECENLEHEVKKRQRKCQDLESQLEDERGKNEQLKEEADLLRRKAQLLDQTRVDNEELREELSKVTAQHNSVLEENQRLRAKLENLEQVLKHMREVAERRQQLELEHEQALAILKFKQDEIKRLQRAQLFAKREHEGVVQMLEELTQLVLRRELSTLDCMQSKVRDLEEKCRSQTEQFGLLSQELENFRLQASKADLAGSGLLNNPSFSVLTNGVGLSTERDCTDSSWDMESLSEIAFWSLEGGDNLSCPEDVAAALRMGTTPHAAGLSRVERSPVTKHRELPTISVHKSASSSSKSETANITPKSDTHLSPHKSSPTHEVDTASEVEELDIDTTPTPCAARGGAAKLQVFIARYSYNPYDGPNDNPEVELPLTAGEYIYVYGGMDDDGFYEGELKDGRRGLVPSNFVERVSDDDVMGSHPPETGDMSHNSLPDSSLHSASHQYRLHAGVRASERTEASSASGPTSASSNSALAVSAPLTNGLDLDLEEVGVDTVPYPRKLTLIKQLAKSIIISWDPPLVPAGWGNVWSYNVYVDQELRLNVPFGAQTKAVLERLDINLKAYRVSVQSLTEKGPSDQLRCSMLIGRDVCVAPTQLRVDSITATSANLSWLPCNSNYVHIVSLNEQECELVKAGCYSLCLNNLLPSLQYTIKVEARPHRTPWELPVERREHRSATINFSTLTAVSCPQSGITGPPDAPLDVQLERGPSPGIALISWLPVTIDSAGTSNGVRVTGYTIYADRKKVLEVSSPTAGSALLGPSQIQSLQAAQDLTVRTMSAHGESCDSFPVSVPSKLAAIMAGPAAATLATPTLACTPVGPTPLTFGNSAAKISMLPNTLPAERHMTGLTVVDVAHCPHVPHSGAFVSSASFVKAWANPPSAATTAECEATLPVTSAITPVINVTPPTSSAPQPSPITEPAPAITAVTQATTLEQRRDADSPGTIRPFPSITDFIEDPCAKLGTPERIPTPPKAPITDLLNPQDTLILRPPSTSPLDSEVEEEPENKRLVSIEEFLRQDQDPAYNRTQEGFSRGLVEHPSDFLTDNSRSDLSDILEEDEEDLYSDHFGEAPTRGYTVTANRLSKSEPSDSDDDVLERIIKLPPQVCRNKQLFSIPEVTEEEDRGREEPLPRHVQMQQRHGRLHPRDTEHLHHVSQRHPPYSSPHFPPQQHHFNRDPRSQTKEPSLRQGPLQGKPKLQHRVHYSDAADSGNYPGEKEVRSCEGPTSRRVSVRCPPQSTPNKDRVLLKGLGDRLRREAMLRSQMAAGHGPTLPRPYPVSKTVHTVTSPISCGMEIDVEYGTDDVDEPVACTAGEVVMEQMSSEWWIEGAEMEHIGPSYHQGTKANTLEPSQPTGSEAGPSWGADSEQSSKPVGLQGKRLKGCFDSPKTKGDIRIFVALFPYDPATMSPNPDASEEELPFREGQIITVYGDKDSDGFYRGESCGRLGYVPCNMVSEIQVEDEETRQQLLQQGFLSAEASLEKIVHEGTRTHAQLPSRPVPPLKPRRSKKGPSQAAAPCAGGKPVPGSRKMLAVFDYDPRESSPNSDIEAELTFSAGDVIHVIGDMDEDGFFYGDLNGQRGLVPSNFLQAFPENAPTEHVSAQPAPDHKKESQGSSSPEPQEADPSTLRDALSPQAEAPVPDQPEHVDPQAHLQMPASTASGPGPAPSPVPARASPPTPHLAASQLHTDCSTQGKKKKGFFSKGKKLFKRFGSGKKD
ncbi:peripheral-type benzodiazepine receptor-associated protein 1 isoform X5 [Dunckerocampus dactyliophorus]|uniref:peripheral-type benzodiazepine receptor-associated protein 1 isoform X5 n=1 Tax=Dunckerocampus dactyliophorus TaxID=161453 RepID=UPI0024075C10|nr:peripheral-type benzodiazepine receptor-associated protein 1 isoform X5 [Dunckerocampus dactyliophorus]